MISEIGHFSQKRNLQMKDLPEICGIEHNLQMKAKLLAVGKI